MNKSKLLFKFEFRNLVTAKMKTLARAGILFVYSANCCLLKLVVAGLSRGQKRSRNFSESAFRVAGERLVLSGKIQFPFFPLESSNSKWETSSFFYKIKASRSIRILETSLLKTHSQECKTFLSNVSCITEMFLD